MISTSLSTHSGRVRTALFFTWLLSTTAFSQSESRSHTGYQNRGPEIARLIVKFHPEASELRKHALSAESNPSEVILAVRSRARALSERSGIALDAGRPVSDQAQVIFATGISSHELATRLSADPSVEYAVEDHRRTHMATPNDPYFSSGPPITGNTGGPTAGQWYLHAPTAGVVSSINAVQAWDYVLGNSSVVVAILDTGIRPDHPDLTSKLLPGYDMISDASIANDGDGRDSDAADPGDWVTSAESNDPNGDFFQCEVSDSSWHGTITASLVGAASNNAVGMAGVAWGIHLLPIRVLGKCGGYDSDIIAGMNWAAGLPVPGLPINATPAKVLNLSLGGIGSCTRSYIDAINAITNKPNPGTIVVAAGNVSGQAVTSPANCPGVIAVGGLRHTGTKVGYSAVGPEIALSAPAGNCVNTNPGSPCLYPLLAASNTGLTVPANATYTDSFNSSLGTSFSSPLVAGAVALMLSVNPTLTPARVKALLQQSARAFKSATGSNDPIPTCIAPSGLNQLECYCTSTTCGAGMLDVSAATLSVGTFQVQRFADIRTGGYFFTLSEREINEATSDSARYRAEGAVFRAFPTQQPGTLPVFRFFNSITGGHFYTADEMEKSVIIDNYSWYKYEGIAFYAYPRLTVDHLPVYRFSNTAVGNHFFTINEAEKDFITRNYGSFRYEGIGFFTSP